MKNVFLLFLIFLTCLLNSISAQGTKENANTTLSNSGILEVLVKESNNELYLDSVKIEFHSSEKPGEIKTIVTNKDGIAQAHLEPGKYTITKIEKDDIYYEKSTLQKQVTVEDGKTTHIKLSLSYDGNISGIVRNENGEPVPGVLIFSYPAEVDEATTDSNGIFTTFNMDLLFAEISSEDTSCCIIARHREKNLIAMYELIDKKDNLDIKLSKGVILRGKVVDTNDNGITNLKIGWMLGSEGYSRNEPVEIDKKGYFQIKALPGGFECTIDIEAEGFGSDQVDIQTSQSPGEIFDLDPIVLKPANISVSGIVVDNNDKPVADADIYTFGKGQPNLGSKTDDKGRFTFDKVCAGKINIGVYKSQDGTMSYGNLLTEGGAKDVKIILGESGHDRFVTPLPASLKGKPLPDMNSVPARIKPETIQNKSVLIYFFDIEQRPSRNCIIELSKKSEELKSKKINIILVHASTIEEKYLNNWLKENNILFPVSIIKGDIEQMRFNWGVKALPWLILTDKEHVVTNEGFSINELDENFN